MNKQLVHIAIPQTVNRHFTYSVSPELAEQLIAGHRCLVPFGKRTVAGYFVKFADDIPDFKIKPVAGLIEPESLFNTELYGFLKWMSEYYFCNIADVLSAALPPRLRGKNKIPKVDSSVLDKGILLGYSRNKDVSQPELGEIYKDSEWLTRAELLRSGLSPYKFAKYKNDENILPIFGLPRFFDYIRPRQGILELKPSGEQVEAIAAICDGLSQFNPFLLYGITGSGKTLVYCRICQEILKQNKTALILVPEIALAGTLLAYFKSFFPDNIALLHSGLNPKERLLIWQNIRNGKYKIVIGARSAIFAPLKNLGLIIVDEEHDESYKQDDPAPRFQGRDAAVMRAKMARIPIILGSATPSVESFYNAEQGRYKLLKLTHRPESFEIPLVILVDLKEEHSSSEEGIFFTRTIISKIKKSLNRNEQVILYLNRRGFSPKIKCGDCGHTPDCPHCKIGMTYHKVGNKLMCHFCGHTDIHHNVCTQCNGTRFIFIGAGTQKIEDILAENLKEARIVRLDSDSTSGKLKAHQILSDFAAEKYNILLGTQMVTKGIDFPKVSLVGVMTADIGLDMPDFRASEKLFAKLIQVAGRSGRGIIPGEVVIQTFRPQLDLIDDAARQDYDTFYGREVMSREMLVYPPFSHLINFRLSGKKEEAVVKASNEFRPVLEERLKKQGVSAMIIGPAPCPLYQLRGAYRRQMFVKTKQILKFIKFLNIWNNETPNFGVSSSIKLTVDIDPYDMM
ncbi:MAG: primosomal protein N' [Candidatus Zixiibacteriota bacterium]